MNWNARPRMDATPAWAQLSALAQPQSINALFEAEPDRVQTMQITAPHVLADLSKQRIDRPTWHALLQLASQTQVPLHRAAMFAGEAINATEGRAVMHWLLRTPANGLQAFFNKETSKSAVDTARAAPDFVAKAHHDVLQVRAQMLAYAQEVRANSSITDVVNIGIGGSDLGPLMANLALADFASPAQRIHFVSNVDGHHLADVLARCQPQNTVFLVASKTFTTIETMTNAASARQWFLAGGMNEAAIAEHFVGLTTNLEAASRFGIRTTFGFWDWVGGRYSMWSAIGLPLAIAVGAQNFDRFLQGAHEMDVHFATAPIEKNLPMALALVDIAQRNLQGATSRSVAPYDQRLLRLPAYLQQLEMESNGKRVDARGQALPYPTSPVVWGEPGTNGQHAYFQMLHQGADVVPVEFIAVKTPAHGLAGHHTQTLANVLAQARALMLGSVDAGGHKHFPGNRPSTMLVLNALTPESFGALIALYEHRVFVQGSIWGVNSFDQFGVELGKVLAKDLAARLDAPALSTEGLDPSTAALLQLLRA